MTPGKSLASWMETLQSRCDRAREKDGYGKDVRAIDSVLLEVRTSEIFQYFLTFGGVRVAHSAKYRD